MASTSDPAGPWVGGDVGGSIHCVLAPNPGPMTLDGTNTWIVSGQESSRAIVIDPGPDDERHLQAVLGVLRERGLDLACTLLTHGHFDHSQGAQRFAELSAAPVLALDPAHRHGAQGLAGGDVIELDDLRLEVVGTPGHTGDSLSFLLPHLGALLTGDTVLGRGTSVVAHPDGRLGEYLDSLVLLRDHCQTRGIDLLLPGHGPAQPAAVGVIEGYLAHRLARLEQVRAARAAGARTPRDVVEAVYSGVDRALWPAAELSVRAQLSYLADQQDAS